MAVYEDSRNADTPLIEAIGLNKAFMRCPGYFPECPIR